MGKEGQEDLPSFEYSVKVPQLFTHKALVEGDPEKAIFWVSSFEKTCVNPLAESNLLGGVLLQLSPYFKNEGPALSTLKRVLDAVSHDKYDYAVEFRHRSWLDESRKEIDAAVLEALKERNVANVLIGGPGLLAGGNQTAKHSYMRFHSRNYDIWYKGEKEDDHRLDRYDYLYKKEQLEAWVASHQRSRIKGR